MKCPPQKKKSNKLGNILLWKESSIVPDSFSFNRDTFPKNSAPATLMQRRAAVGSSDMLSELISQDLPVHSDL